MDTVPLTFVAIIFVTCFDTLSAAFIIQHSAFSIHRTQLLKHQQYFLNIYHSQKCMRQSSNSNLFCKLDKFCTHISIFHYPIFDFIYLFCYSTYIYNHMKYLIPTFFALFIAVIILNTLTFTSFVLLRRHIFVSIQQHYTFHYIYPD